MRLRRLLASSGTLAVALMLVSAKQASARVPPYALDSREGVWIGGGDVFIQQTIDRWSVFPAGAHVNKLAVDNTTVWVATDDGVIRFDSGTRQATRMGMDEGLPSQVVTAVAVDDQFVWFATNKGLVRYRKLDRTLRIFTEADGLPHNSVNDALTVGRQVWFGTRAGIAVYTPETDGLRAFTEADGLASGYVAELFQFNDDLWCRTDAGLSRFRVKSRVFTNFSTQEIGGEQLRTFVVDNGVVWIGTENGLFSFDSNGDAIVPFRQQAALQSRNIMGVEKDTMYIWITTDKEVVRYNKDTKAIQRFTLAEGLTRNEGAIGTLLASGLYTVMFEDGAQAYNTGRELWNERSLQVTQGADQGLSYRLFGKFDFNRPYDLKAGKAIGSDSYAKADGGFALGRRFEGGRVFNSWLYTDYGEVTLPGLRDLQFKAEYLGNQSDVVREVNVEDKLKYRFLEEGLERPLLVQGGRVRAASPGKDPKATLTADAGVRRGAVVRDFLTGPRQSTYQLSKRYILAGTERVYVDGELLTSGVDYTVVYTAGQLTFLNPERVDDLSVIWVEYEYDLVNRKGLGALSPNDMLPVDREVGDWARSGDPRRYSDESSLYAAIDGAAPKYIDRGWVRSIYADYRQGSRTITVKINDMGSEVNAESIYTFDLPSAREPVGDGNNIVLDVGKDKSFEIKAHTGNYYLEITIDDNSDAAKQSLKVFALQVLNRGSNAGEHLADQSREALISARAAVAPAPGMEMGVRAVELNALGTGLNGAPGRSLLTGAADARLQRQVGETGLVTAYGEMAGSHGQNPGDTDGWAGTGFLRFSHERAEGTLSYRHDAAGYAPMGSNATRFGRLQDEYKLSTTVYPARWLPTTVFYTRQLSSLGDATPGQGVIQHALARIQLNRDDLPATSIQLGHTMLDDPGTTVTRPQIVGQVDYDLAKVLSFTRIKRFIVRALYSMSEADTENHAGVAPSTVIGKGINGTCTDPVRCTDRVRMLRLESRFSPTTTEQFYGLFRQRIVDQSTSSNQAFTRSLMHWELNGGFQSGIVPGLVPRYNYNASFDEVAQPLAGKATKGSWAASLGIYPGQWWSVLAPVVVEPMFSVSNDEQSAGGYRTVYNRGYRLENRAVYAGTGKLDTIELYQRYDLGTTGSDHHDAATVLMLRNKVIFRPIPISPITIRFNYLKQRGMNDLLTYGAVVGPWAVQATYESSVEWLMRWNAKITTKSGAYGWLSRVADNPSIMQNGTAAPVLQIADYDQKKVQGMFELRLFPLADVSRMYLYQHNELGRTFVAGTGAHEMVDLKVSGGAIVRMGDKLYLEAELMFGQSTCVIASPTCHDRRTLTPRMFFTFNL